MIDIKEPYRIEDSTGTTLIFKPRLEKALIDIDIIATVEDQNENLTWLDPQELEILDQDNPDYTNCKREFINIYRHLEALQIPLIAFYDPYIMEDIEPYKELTDYLDQLHNIATEDLNMIFEAAHNTHISGNTEEILEIATEEEFKILRKDTPQAIENYIDAIEITAHKLYNGTTEYTLFIDKNARYYTDLILISEDQAFKICDYCNQTETIQDIKAEILLGILKLDYYYT